MASVRRRLGFKMLSYLKKSAAPTDNSMFTASFDRLAKFRLWVEQSRSLVNVYAVRLQEANAAAKNLADHIATLYPEDAYNINHQPSADIYAQRPNERNLAVLYQEACHEMCFKFGNSLVDGLRVGMLEPLQLWENHLEEVNSHIEEYEHAHAEFDLFNNKVQQLSDQLEFAEGAARDAINQELSDSLERLGESNSVYQKASKTTCDFIETFVEERKALFYPTLVRLVQSSTLVFAHSHMLMHDLLAKIRCDPLESFKLIPAMGVTRPKIIEGSIYQRGRLLASAVYSKIEGNTLELYKSKEDLVEGGLPLDSCDLSQMTLNFKTNRASRWDRYGLRGGAIVIHSSEKMINLGFGGVAELNQWKRALTFGKTWSPKRQLQVSAQKQSQLQAFVQGKFNENQMQASSSNQPPLHTGNFEHNYLNNIDTFTTPDTSDDEKEQTTETRNLASVSLCATVFQQLLEQCGRTDRLGFEDILSWDEMKTALSSSVFSEPDLEVLWAKATSKGSGEDVQLDLKSTAGFDEFSEFVVLFVERQLQLEIENALDVIDRNLVTCDSDNDGASFKTAESNKSVHKAHF